MQHQSVLQFSKIFWAGKHKIWEVKQKTLFSCEAALAKYVSEGVGCGLRGPSYHASCSGTKLQPSHPSTTAFPTALQLLLGMQTRPFTHKLHLLATPLCSGISAFNGEGKENPAFLQAFILPRDQSTQLQFRG